MRLNLEAGVSVANLQQKVDLYNFSTAQYDLVDTRAGTLADSALTVTPGSSTPYINPADRKVRARVSWKAVAPVLSDRSPAPGSSSELRRPTIGFTVTDEGSGVDPATLHVLLDGADVAAFGTLAIYAHATDQTVDVVGAGPGEVVEFDGRDAPAQARR